MNAYTPKADGRILARRSVAITNRPVGVVRKGNRKEPKITTAKGKVLSLIRGHGQWLVVQASLTTNGDLPVLSRIVPVSELRGQARRKAERWIAWLS